MLAYEIYDYCNFLLLELEKLAELYVGVNTFGNVYERLKEDLSLQIFTESDIAIAHKTLNNDGVGGYCITINYYNGEVEELNECFQKMIKNFDFFGFSSQWDIVKNNILNQQMNIENQDLLFKEYEESMNSFLSDLQRYFQESTQKNKVILSNQVISTSRLYHHLISHYKNTLTMLGTPQLNAVDENETQYFSLQLLKVELSIEEFSQVLISIEKIYKNIAIIIHKDESTLKIGKIESGSLLTLVLGDENIIAILTSLFNKCIALAFKKFTKEGKIARIKDYIEITRDGLLLKKEMDEAGLDTTRMVESLENAAAQTAISIEKIIGVGSPNIKINEEEHNISGDIALKYIEENKTLKLNAGIDKESIKKNNKE